MKTTIYSQHHDHTAWLNKLLFYNDELQLMQKKLEEVNSRNTGADVKKKVEHFQNQLLIQKNNSDDLCHYIRRREKEILNSIKKNIDYRQAEDHSEERAMIDGFEKNFNALRKAFNAFLADRL